MADKKQQPDHVKLKSKLNSKRQYQNYVFSGGTSDFKTWQKENK